MTFTAPRPADLASDRDRVPAYFLYGEPLRPPDEGTVHIETIAARSRLHDWQIRPHRHHDLHQVLIVWRGTVDARVDVHVDRLSGPALVVVPPGTVHSFNFAPDTEGLVVTFAAGLARELLRGHAHLAESLDAPTAIGLKSEAFFLTELEQIGSMLLRESGRAAAGRDVALRGLLGALLANLLRLLREPVGTATTAANQAWELVTRFRAAVERHYREHLDLESYASEIRTSPAALRRACRTVAGQSPSDLVQMRLLIEAERQLRYTGISVTQIAYSLGFEDPAYFSRFFTRRMGISPRAFRSHERRADTNSEPARGLIYGRRLSQCATAGGQPDRSARGVWRRHGT